MISFVLVNNTRANPKTFPDDSLDSKMELLSVTKMWPEPEQLEGRCMLAKPPGTDGFTEHTELTPGHIEHFHIDVQIKYHYLGLSIHLKAGKKMHTPVTIRVIAQKSEMTATAI